MQNTIIYPFSSKCIPLLLYFAEIHPPYRISSLVSPPGLGLAGHSPFYAANRASESSLLVQSDIESALHHCDALLVPFGDTKNDPSYYDVITVIHQAAKMRKEIFCCLKLSNIQRKMLKEICEQHGAIWHDGWQESINMRKHTSYGKHSISAPVIFIHNFGIEADCFEITLSLAHRFLKDGYKISVIGPAPEYNILGFHGSSLLLDALYGIEPLKLVPQFIKAINQYVHMVETIESPDVILFHCPGAAAPMSELIQNDSGVYTYLISRSIRPDFSLVCMAYSALTESAVQIIHKELEYQFGFGIDALHLSNRALHIETTKFTGTEQHVYLPENTALERINSIRLGGYNSIPVFCALTEKEKDQLYNHVVRTLKLY